MDKILTYYKEKDLSTIISMDWLYDIILDLFVRASVLFKVVFEQASEITNVTVTEVNRAMNVTKIAIMENINYVSKITSYPITKIENFLLFLTLLVIIPKLSTFEVRVIVILAIVKWSLNVVYSL